MLLCVSPAIITCCQLGPTGSRQISSACPSNSDSSVGGVKDTFFWISNLHIKQTMYFGVKLRTFQGFFIPVWFGVGQVQKTKLSSHLKTLKLSRGGGAMFNLSWLHR